MLLVLTEKPEEIRKEILLGMGGGDFFKTGRNLFTFFF
ncbi:hypothetical protein LEP1GSC150_0797 [Leptospira interrogans serovar Copenhageni str. LT2050]|uniref:Uncharacterized protein n=1 Tax=Leptospira interrogans serovar Copenhageni str. LT2050 TaxID=1001598 RepID=M3HYR4_LEPIT|nr:hypothetical protein LEP1GSC150_0797 [Leptospira interrogans serovar Copenhageni str. LT2050]